MKNQIITATPAGFVMPSCAAVLADCRDMKVRDAHAGATNGVRQTGSHSWMRLRST